MEWFSEWWGSLALFSQIMYCVALPATIILLIQAVMIIIGFGPDNDMGVDTSDTSGLDGDMSGADGVDAVDPTDLTDIKDVHDGGNPADAGSMHFFTIQGFVTFLAVFGWSGVILFGSTQNIIISVIVAFVLGLAAMFGVAKLLQVTAKLAQNGTVNTRNLLGAKGTVYLVIPASGDGKGKVNVVTDERFLEYDAITDGDEALPDGTSVRVTDIRSGNVLVVERYNGG